MTTTNKSLNQPAYNDPNWDVPLNENFGYIDKSLGSSLSLSSTSGTVALTQDQCRNLIFNVTGLLLANTTYQIPSGVGGMYIVNNGTTGSYTLTISSAGGGTSVTVDQGKVKTVYSDGTNITTAASDLFSGGTITGNLAITGSLCFTSTAQPARETLDLRAKGIAGVTVIYGDADNSAMKFAGGASSTNGGTITLTGSTYANPSIITFSANGTEWSRFNSSGQFLIGSTSSAYPARSFCRWTPTTEQGLVIQSSNETYSASPVLFVNSLGSIVGSISQTTASVAFNTTSDYRLKENIKPLDFYDALKAVLNLNPVHFTWKANKQDAVGFIAHEFGEHILNGATGTFNAKDEEGNIIPQQIDKSKAVPYLVAAIKFMAEKIEKLETKVAELDVKGAK